MKRFCLALVLAAPFFVGGYATAPVRRAVAADPAALVAPPAVSVAVGRMARIELQTTCKSVVCVNLADDVSDVFREYTESGYTFRFLAPVPGVYKLVFVGAVADRPVTGVTVVTVTGTVPPAPPGPDPPKPPSPDPPIPGEGLRVLMVYESADLAKYPKAQRDVLYSETIRAYLRDKCAKGPDGKTPECRWWDQNVDTANESKTWQDVFKRERKSLPWIVIGAGKAGGYEGPLPPDIDSTMALIKKYGEVK